MMHSNSLVVYATRLCETLGRDAEITSRVNTGNSYVRRDLQ